MMIGNICGTLLQLVGPLVDRTEKHSKNCTMQGLNDFCDLGWLAIFGPSLYVHYISYCIIGLCHDLQTPYKATFESTLFVFSVCSLLAEARLWPKSLKRPPKALMYIYMAFASILLTNLAFRLVWLPLVDLQVLINKELSSWLATISMCLGFGKKSKFYHWAEWLATPPGLVLGSRLWSIALFLWMLNATSKFEHTWKHLERICRPFLAAVCTEFNPNQSGKSRRGNRRRSSNLCGYLDECGSATIIDPAESEAFPPVTPHANISWDEDTD